MTRCGALAEDDIATGLPAGHERKSLLRFLTCGSVDDGKSTLIGRLLYDAHTLPDDQLAALEKESAAKGAAGGALDFALLVDGLAAEREQGITIDVAYRFFSTGTRKFIVADTPGHEQYTRNMVTGASTADAAVILIDARKGVLTQTRRHSYLCRLMGIGHIALAVNKMDLTGWDQAVFDRIVAQYRNFASEIGIDGFTAIPTAALSGDNVAMRSQGAPWYAGPTLLDWLSGIEVEDEAAARPFRLPVQWVNRPNLDFRSFCGLIAAGTVKPGDRVRVLPSGRTSTVARIIDADGQQPLAVAGQSVGLTLTDEIDVSRGDVIACAADPAAIADQLAAMVVWMDDQALTPGQSYLLKLGARTVSARVAALDHRIDINSLQRHAAADLPLNGIGAVRLHLDQPIAFSPYAENRDLGGFILIDRITNHTVAAGMVQSALRRADNIHWQHTDVDKAARAALNGHGGRVVWLTGLSGAGKSTIANLVEKKLHALGRHTYLLDGDNVRHGLSRDLGFSPQDRTENIRRVAETAKLMADAGLIVITAFISPFTADRRLARDLVEAGEFVEVFIDAPLAVAETRDTKGLYAKARAGALPGFTGIDSPYEPPSAAEIHIDTTQMSALDAADRIVAWLEA